MKLAYTVKEAAEELGLAPLTVRKLIRNGELVARKCGNERGILIGRAAIEAFLATPDPKVIVTKCNNTRNPSVPLSALKSPCVRGGRK